MSTIPSNLPPTIGGHPDLSFTAALQKVSPQVRQKLKTTAQDFESVFLGQMFSQMTEGLKGDGPFGSTVGTGVWRSMLTDEYAKSFAKAGGIGIADQVYKSLMAHQEARS